MDLNDAISAAQTAKTDLSTKDEALQLAVDNLRKAQDVFTSSSHDVTAAIQVANDALDALITAATAAKRTPFMTTKTT